MNHIGMAIGIGVLVAGACELADIGTEVKYVGPSQTARPLDCRMPMTFGPVSYPHEDIARARTQCPDDPAYEEMCFDDMRRKACLVGADTVYGITEKQEDGVGYLTATFARSLPGPIDDPASRPPAERACDPICSPGFACQKGTCVPQCNPACATDEICTSGRLCVARASTSRMSKSSHREDRREIATVISWGQAKTPPEAGSAVDADLPREAGAQAASVPRDQGVVRVGPDGDVANVRSDVPAERSGVDSVRTAPEVKAADGVLLPARRANALR